MAELEAGGISPPRKIKGKAGPIHPVASRSLRVPYKAGPKERGNKLFVKQGPGEIPFGERGPLSDPRTSVTSSSPLWKVFYNLRSWHEQRYGRLPDRGGMAPIQGQRIILPDGQPGGVSRPLLPLHDGAENFNPGPNATTGQVKKYFHDLKQSANRIRSANKRAVVELVPGVPALSFAQAPRFRPGRPNPIQGQTDQAKEKPGLYGAEASTGAVPGSVRAGLANQRIARQANFGPLMRQLYDPPILTLGEAVKRTPQFIQLMREGRTAEAQALFPTGGMIGYRFGTNPNNTGSERAGRIKGTGDILEAGSTVQEPGSRSEAEQIAGQIATGKIGLGDAVRLTPSLMRFLPSGERTTWTGAIPRQWGTGGAVPSLTEGIALAGTGFPTTPYGSGGGSGGSGGAGGGGGSAGSSGGGGSFGLGNIGPLAIVAAIAYFALRR